MDRNEAIRKAASLLTLAARGGTVGEAAAAAARAQSIMDRFELTHDLVSGLSAKDAEEEAIESFYDRPSGWLDSTPEKQPWRYQLASAIAEMHGAFIFTSRRSGRHQHSTLEIVGRPSSVEAVRYLYAWLAEELLNLITKYGRGMGGVWRREFAEGCASEVARRLHEQRTQTVREVKAEYSANPYALVQIETNLQRMQDAAPTREFAYKRHGLVSGGSRRVQSNATARDLGRTAGRAVNLSPVRGSIGPGAARQIGGRS